MNYARYSFKLYKSSMSYLTTSMFLKISSNVGVLRVIAFHMLFIVVLFAVMLFNSVSRSYKSDFAEVMFFSISFKLSMQLLSACNS
jgi:Mg2+/Co2+ transporter CorB